MIKQTNNMSDNIGSSPANLDAFLFENHSTYFIFPKKIYRTFRSFHINIYHWVTFSLTVIPEKWGNTEIPDFKWFI